MLLLTEDVMKNPKESKKTSLDIVNEAHKNAQYSSVDFQLSQTFSESMSALSQLSERLREKFNDISLPYLPSHEESTQSITLYENPSHETNRLLREVNLKLDSLSEQTAKLVAPNFDANNCEIIFANKRVQIPKNTNQAELVKSLFSEKDNLAREWDWSEILEDWGYQDFPKEDWRKVYMAAREVNKKVAIETGVKDLLKVTKLTVAINPNYLGQIS